MTFADGDLVLIAAVPDVSNERAVAFGPPHIFQVSFIIRDHEFALIAERRALIRSSQTIVQAEGSSTVHVDIAWNARTRLLTVKSTCGCPGQTVRAAAIEDEDLLRISLLTRFERSPHNPEMATTVDEPCLDRLAVAASGSTDIGLLAKLAFHESGVIRQRVADNVATPLRVRALIATMI